MIQMASIDLNAGGMHCSSCSMLIEMTVSDLAGVSSASADYVNGTAHVEYDPSIISVDQIVAAIRDAGYSADVAA
jgi:copper chaperone CopZ